MSQGNEMDPVVSRRVARLEQTSPHTPVRRAATPSVRWSRRRGVVGVFAAVAAFGLLGAYVMSPTGALLAEAAPSAEEATTIYSVAADGAQSIAIVSEAADATFERGTYQVYVAPKPTPTPTPRAAERETASASRPLYTGGGSKTDWLIASGIPESEWAYVDYIVGRESGWNPNATNKSSGACGLVQALPCGKVPGNGYDPIDNLRWANGYAVGRYGSWAQAYDFWVSRHWW